MTVAELKAVLDKMPPNSDVVVEYDVGKWFWIDDVYLYDPDTSCVVIAIKQP